MNTIKMLTIVFLILLFQQPLFATLNLTEEERAYITVRAPVLAVSVDGSAPIQYTDSQGKIRGIAVKVLQEIGNRTGLTFENRLITELDQLHEVYTAGDDIIFGIPKQYAMPGYPLSSPFLQSQTILFVNKKIQPQDLENKRFAATYSSALPTGISEEQAIYYQSREDAIKAVNKGEADFGYGNAYSVAFYTLRYGFRDIYTIPQKMEERQYSILFIKDDPLLISIINKALASISPQEMQNITLEVTSQVERIITPTMIMDIYGGEFFLIFLSIITILVAALAFVLRSRETLNFEKMKFQTIAEVSNEYLFEYDIHHKTLIFYKKFSTLFTTSEALKAAENKLIAQMTTTPSPEDNPIIKLEMPNGSSGFFRLSSSKVPREKKKRETWIGKLQDISEEIKKQHVLENLAKTDGLTGLLNATTTHHYVETRLQHKQSSETDYCILFDLDDFKSVNDTMGHLAGNKVLEAIGDVLLQSNHTHADIIGRVGGDEFCIYLVAVQSEKAALSYCASLLEAVRVRFSDDQVTISMGMARVAEKDTYETLYTRVDFAMYQAKSKGKNRLEIVDTQTNTRT